MRDLRLEAQKLEKKLSKIKVCAFDVDGILTDGNLYFSGEEMGWNRFFHALDGFGLKTLKNLGFKVGVISGGESKGLNMRIDYLNLDFSYLGNEDKLGAWEDIKRKFNVEDHEIMFMGDDLFDIPILEKAGFAATVPISSHEVQEACHYITERFPGNAPAREVMDIMRYSVK